MAYREDVEIVKKYFKKKYGCSVRVSQEKDKELNINDPRIKKWQKIVSEVMGCTEEYLLSKGRVNNAHEKMWFRYMLITQEGVSLSKLYPLLHLGDHSTLCANVKVCNGWTEVYPELYSQLLDKGIEYDRENDLRYKILYDIDGELHGS